MSRSRQPVVAIDLDDTCADRLGIIADMLRAEGVEIQHQRPESWDLSDWGVRDQAHYDRLHYDAFVHNPGYRTMLPLPGAVQCIGSLHEHGYLIRIVTGRLWSSSITLTALSDTAAWLAEHKIPANDIAFVSDKTAIQADVYIEDAPHFIVDLQKAGRDVIVMDAPYNRHLPGPRVASWDNVQAIVEKLLAQRSETASAIPAVSSI